MKNEQSCFIYILIILKITAQLQSLITLEFHLLLAFCPSVFFPEIQRYDNQFISKQTQDVLPQPLYSAVQS